MEHRIIRSYVQLRDEFIFRLRIGDVPQGCETVLHWSGAALFVLNNSPNTDAVVFVDVSDDEFTWTPIGITTYGALQQLSLTVVPQSMATSIILNPMRSVRIRLQTPIDQGVYIHLVQWKPLGFEHGYM